MKKISSLFVMSAFLIVCTSGISAQTVTKENSLQAQIKDYEIDAETAYKMINYFFDCTDTSCKNPVFSEDNGKVMDKIVAAHPHIKKLEVFYARFKDTADAVKYCTTRGLTPGSEDCKVIGYTIHIIKITYKPVSAKNKAGLSAAKSAYYSFYKICPPPQNCAKYK